VPWAVDGLRSLTDRAPVPSLEDERVRNTRLWQDSGSPIIQGRTRGSRTFWPSVSVAWLLSCASTFALMKLWLGWSVSAKSIGVGVLGAGLGAAVGMWLVRRMGNKTRAWLVGVALGIVCGLAAVALAGFAKAGV
jgi:hypothetical protein